MTVFNDRMYAPCSRWPRGLSEKGTRRQSIAFRLTIVIVVLCSILAFPAWTFADDATVKTVKEIVGHLRSAIKEFDANPTLENRIRVATWRVMLGEIATEGGDDLSLWSVSLDEIEAGRKALAEIEDQIAKAPDLERRISKQPRIAMRLDAVRVR